MTNIVAELLAKLGLDITEFKEGARDASREADSLGRNLETHLKKGTEAGKETTSAFSKVNDAVEKTNAGVAKSKTVFEQLGQASTATKVAVIGLGGAIATAAVGVALLVRQFEDARVSATRFAEVQRVIGSWDVGAITNQISKSVEEMDAISRETESFWGRVIYGMKNALSIVGKSIGMDLKEPFDLAAESFEKLREGLIGLAPILDRIAAAKTKVALAGISEASLPVNAALVLQAGGNVGAYPGTSAEDALQSPYGGALAGSARIQAEARRSQAFEELQRKLQIASQNRILDIEGPRLEREYLNTIEVIDQSLELHLRQIALQVREMRTRQVQENLRRFDIDFGVGNVEPDYRNPYLTPTDPDTLARMRQGFDEQYRLQAFTETQTFQDLVRRVRADYPFPDESQPENQRFTMPSFDEVEAARTRETPTQADLRVKLQNIGAEAQLVKRDYFDPLTESINATRVAMEQMIETGIEPTDARLASLSMRFQELQNVKELRTTFQDTFAAIGNAVTTSLNGVIQGTQSVSEAFARMGQSILLSIANEAITKAIKSLTNNLWDLAGPLLTSLSSLGGSTSFSAMSSSSWGALVSSSGGQPYAEGGVVTRPTLALVGEGGESEAIVPLSRAGEFGFGGGGVTQNIIVNAGVAEAVRREVNAMRPQLQRDAVDAIIMARNMGGSVTKAVGERRK